MASNVNPLEKHISEAEKLLNKYELKLNEYNGNVSKVPTDFVPLSEVSLADEAWHSKMTEGEYFYLRFKMPTGKYIIYLFYLQYSRDSKAWGSEAKTFIRRGRIQDFIGGGSPIC